MLISIPLMTEQEVDVVNLVEGASPSEQLVEGVALSAIVVLVEQTTSVGLVTVLRVHVEVAVAGVVVHTEVNGKLDTLAPAIFLEVATQDDTSTQTSDITHVACLVEQQHTQ